MCAAITIIISVVLFVIMNFIINLMITKIYIYLTLKHQVEVKVAFSVLRPIGSLRHSSLGFQSTPGQDERTPQGLLVAGGKG